MNNSALLNSVDIFSETYRYLRESRQSYSDIEVLKAKWASSILSRLNVETKITGESTKNKSVILVGNHISYLDIPLLLKTAPQISFVAKKELSS